MSEAATLEAPADAPAPVIIEPATFWAVWTKSGHKPRFTHNTLESAQTEADRLARLNPGKKFIVLAAVDKRHVEGASA